MSIFDNLKRIGVNSNGDTTGNVLDYRILAPKNKLGLYNSSFENYADNNYAAPQKKTLQDAYNEAMAKTTPTWATALAGAMPAIGEIVASQTIKDPWQQESVAGSLERQKDRQQAYNQFLQQQENEKVKDFVQMAKEQLGMDAADEDKAYNREIANLARNDAYDARKQAYQQWESEQDLKNKIADANIANINANIKKTNADIAAINAQNTPEALAKKKDMEDLDIRGKIAAVIKAERENDPDYIAEQEKQALYAKNREIAKSFYDKGTIDNAALIEILNNPSRLEDLVPKEYILGIKGNKNMVLAPAKKKTQETQAIKDIEAFDKKQGW